MENALYDFYGVISIYLQWNSTQCCLTTYGACRSVETTKETTKELIVNIYYIASSFNYLRYPASRVPTIILSILGFP